MPCDPFSVPVHSYLPRTHSLCLSDYLMCTHVHTKGSYQAAVCLKCCFYIAVIFHFGLLSLNCLWGFVWGEEPSHLYMRQKGEKNRGERMFMFLFIFFVFFSLCVWCMLFHIVFYFLYPAFYQILLCVKTHLCLSPSLFACRSPTVACK